MYDTFSVFTDGVCFQGDRFDQVQGALHALCLLVKGIEATLALPLPYKLSLEPLGFSISDSCLRYVFNL